MLGLIFGVGLVFGKTGYKTLCVCKSSKLHFALLYLLTGVCFTTLHTAYGITATLALLREQAYWHTTGALVPAGESLLCAAAGLRRHARLLLSL